MRPHAAVLQVWESLRTKWRRRFGGSASGCFRTKRRRAAGFFQPPRIPRDRWCRSRCPPGRKCSRCPRGPAHDAPTTTGSRPRLWARNAARGTVCLHWTSSKPFNSVACPTSEHRSPQVISAFEIPPVPLSDLKFLLRTRSGQCRNFKSAALAGRRQNPNEANREKLMGRLEGKSVIITGAGSGIGRAASLLFTKEGAKLIAVDRTEAVKETVEQVRKAGGTAEAVMADAGSEKEVIAFIDRAVSAYGRLDAIWANAGVSGGLVPLAEQTVEHWQEVLRVNLIGPFLAIKYSIPHMIKQKSGSIVCTASVAGLKAGASGHPYGASKAGVISLVQTTAYSLSGTGVRINAVCPGLIETGMTKPVFDRAKERGTQDKIGQLNPLKRAGQPHELAAMGLFLASDEASYVNGQAIPVDGGLTASMPYAGKPI